MDLFTHRRVGVGSEIVSWGCDAYNGGQQLPDALRRKVHKGLIFMHAMENATKHRNLDPAANLSLKTTCTQPATGRAEKLTAFAMQREPVL